MNSNLLYFFSLSVFSDWSSRIPVLQEENTIHGEQKCGVFSLRGDVLPARKEDLKSLIHYSTLLIFFQIMCFTAFCVVSMVTAIVSIQLLRLGLVNHTTDGHTFQKEHLDLCILIALGTTGVEIVVCLISPLASLRLAKMAKKEMETKREGPFYVEVLGQKDIVVVSRQSTPACSKKKNREYRLKREHIHATIL